MLDVHPPDHSLHSVRDFVIHLLTITVGLLIALGLENAAEAMHHRHQRREAEETMRVELKENRQKLVTMQTHTADEIANLTKVLMFSEHLRAGQKDDPSALKMEFNVNPLENAGWSTASATGALSYMDYGEVQRFSTAYHVQEDYESAAAHALSDYELLATYLASSPDPRAMTPQDIDTAIPDVRRVLADLRTMADVGRGTLKAYDESLQ